MADRSVIVVAPQAHTGELSAFDRYSGVDLVDAVTAGTGVPQVIEVVGLCWSLRRERSTAVASRFGRSYRNRVVGVVISVGLP